MSLRPAGILSADPPTRAARSATPVRGSPCGCRRPATSPLTCCSRRKWRSATTGRSSSRCTMIPSSSKMIRWSMPFHRGLSRWASPTTMSSAKAAPGIDIVGQPFPLNFEALVRALTDPDKEIRRILDWPCWRRPGQGAVVAGLRLQRVLLQEPRYQDPRTDQPTKIRVCGGMPGDLMKCCGGVPLVISASKQHQAAKEGTFAMISTGITGVDSRKLREVADTVTRTEHTALAFGVIINEKLWQSLPAHLQAVFVESARKVERNLREQMAEIEAKADAFARA